jgi:hypothetical protein
VLSGASRECLDRRLIAFLAILTCGNFKSLAVIVLNPNAILMDPAVSDFANAVRCHKTYASGEDHGVLAIDVGVVICNVRVLSLGESG